MNRHRIKQALPPHLEIARPSRWRLRAGLACVLLAPAVLLSACGGGSSSGGSGTSASAGSTPTQGGTIYYAHEMETPCLTGGWEQEGYVERQFLDNIVAESHGGKIVPWLADLLDGIAGSPDLHLPSQARSQIHRRDAGRRAGDRRQLELSGEPEDGEQRGRQFLHRPGVQVRDRRQRPDGAGEAERTIRAVPGRPGGALRRHHLAENARGGHHRGLRQPGRQRAVHIHEVEPRG